jgi:Family of unknown function (DUF5946)
MIDGKATKCPGCGAMFAPIEGPIHAYMTSSPACWAAFGALLAHEYASESLMTTHRLSVDTYAVQHPGDPNDRRAVQSVGLHLARLMRQLEATRPPRETNDVMVGFAARKETLIYLESPAKFSMTVQDVAPFAGGPRHSEKVGDWARSAWNDWSAHHAWIKRWAEGG